MADREDYESAKAYFEQNHVKPADLKKRRDIKALLDMPDKEFKHWYSLNRINTSTLLDFFQRAGRVPSLLMPEMEAPMGAEAPLQGVTNSLERTLKYLAVIKYLRSH